MARFPFPRLAATLTLLCIFGSGAASGGQIGWTRDPQLGATLPEGIQVFRGRGDGLRAIYALFEPDKNPGLEWQVATAAGQAMTPLDFSRAMTGQTYVVINGGYFDATHNLSLVIQDGVVLAPGVARITRDGKPRYPARAAIGRMASGRSEVRRILPAGADGALFPIDAPSSPWRPVTAIGGGPQLVAAGVKSVSALEELFDVQSGIAAAARAPRTAVAMRADGAMLLLVVDGRSKESAGVTLDELADMLVDLGATQALNLDGGGSSAMVVGGVLANQPSDSSGIRKVRSVLAITDRRLPGRAETREER